MENIASENGFVEVYMGTTNIVSKYDYIVHVINMEEVVIVMQQFRHNLDIIGESPHQLIAKEQLNEMEDMMHTLCPRRKARGLVNAGGALMKFVFGTMDEEDRQNMEEHQKILEENNHQLIEELNQQVVINNNFNNSLHTLKDIILADRREIERKINEANELDKRVAGDNLAITQLFKIGILKRKMESLRRTIVSARLGIFTPIILIKIGNTDKV